MKQIKVSIFAALLGCFLICGCSGIDGNHPPLHATKKVQDMTKQERLDRIDRSPLPRAEKMRLTQEEQGKP